MRFASPLFLLLLLVLPFAAYLSFKRKKPSGFIYPDSSLAVKNLPGGGKRGLSLFSLKAAALALLILALARPQQGLITSESSTRGIDIMLCLDTSTSMRALDFKPKNRLDAARDAAIEFVKARRNDRIGVVVYSALAFTQCPLTTDHSALLGFIERVEIGMTQMDGTAIGTAILTCVSRLKDSSGKSKVIILLTDGRNNMGEVDPVTAAKAAQSSDIKIYAIGMGAPGKALYPVDDPVLGTQYVYLPEELDEGMLTQIAGVTGGEYFRARNRQELRDIYKQINKLEKTEIKTSQFTEYKELFRIFALPGLLILAGAFILERTLYRKIP